MQHVQHVQHVRGTCLAFGSLEPIIPFFGPEGASCADTGVPPKDLPNPQLSQLSQWTCD